LDPDVTELKFVRLWRKININIFVSVFGFKAFLYFRMWNFSLKLKFLLCKKKVSSFWNNLHYNPIHIVEATGYVWAVFFYSDQIVHQISIPYLITFGVGISNTRWSCTACKSYSYIQLALSLGAFVQLEFPYQHPMGCER